MPHVVTQSCCSDGSCVYACPVNCIQPTPDSPDFALAEMLHVDPITCVDCGACVSACPVGAIKPHQRLTEVERPFQLINADYFAVERERPLLARPAPRLQVREHAEPLRVAVVGSGPAAMYTADEILTIPGAEVDVYERLDRPYGLARFGVAPDHRRTRDIIARQLSVIAAQPRLRLCLGVEVGRDITHHELLRHHHAVVYAVGAATDRRLEVPGAEATVPATAFVAWYNGHPEAPAGFDLAHERVVVIGNGNVALDVARILTVDPDVLAGTDIAPAALAALRASRVREVVVAGRRNAAHAAFTLPELVGLLATPGVDLLARPEEVAVATGPGAKLGLLRELPSSGSSARRIVLRFGLRAERITPGGVEFPDEAIPAGLMLTSVGYRGVPIPDLPFDADRCVVPNAAGRVVDPATGEPVPGTFVAGWIKRGARGFIGTNKPCAQETVRALVEDWNAGRLSDRPRSFVRTRCML